MAMIHKPPQGPERRLIEAEARAGVLADALRGVLESGEEIAGHLRTCLACQAGRSSACPDLRTLLENHALEQMDAEDVLSRTTGAAFDGESFSVCHSGEWLDGICPECMALIAGQALRLLPEERQRLLIATAPAGEKLLGAVRRISHAARRGRIEPEAMDALEAAVGAFPARKELQASGLARAVRRAGN